MGGWQGVGRSLNLSGPNPVCDLGLERRARAAAFVADYSSLWRFAWKMGSKVLAISGLSNLAYERSKGILRATGYCWGMRYGDRRSGGWPSASRCNLPDRETYADLEIKSVGAHRFRPFPPLNLSKMRIPASAPGAAFKNRRAAPTLYGQPVS